MLVEIAHLIFETDNSETQLVTFMKKHRISAKLDTFQRTQPNINMAGYSSVERGSRNSLEYRLFFKDGSGKVVSAMHDIPMLSSKI